MRLPPAALQSKYMPGAAAALYVFVAPMHTSVAPVMGPGAGTPTTCTTNDAAAEQKTFGVTGVAVTV